MERWIISSTAGGRIECGYSADSDWVEVRVEGDIGDDELRRGLEPCSFCEIERRLVDLRRIGSFRVTVPEFRRFMNHRLDCGGRIAVVTEDPLAFGLFRMVQGWTAEDQGELGVFSCSEAAKEWLLSGESAWSCV